MKYTLTLDLAAANIVAVLTDENDNQTTTRYAYAGVEFPSDPVSPDNIVTTLLDTLTTINNGLPGDTDVLSEVHFVSGIANGWIALDADFNALTEVISGGDNRATKYVDALMINGIGGQLQRKTGLPMTPTEPLALTLWLKNENQDAYANAAHYMGVQEFIVNRLFGLNEVDEAHAARTGFYNVAHQDWDIQALAVTGLVTEQLPTLTTADAIATPLLATVATQTGLTDATTFYRR